MDVLDADQWSKFTEAERIQQCRIAARQAEGYAKTASPDLREIYKNLTAQWDNLADEIEARQPVRRTG